MRVVVSLRLGHREDMDQRVHDVQIINDERKLTGEFDLYQLCVTSDSNLHDKETPLNLSCR